MASPSKATPYSHILKTTFISTYLTDSSFDYLTKKFNNKYPGDENISNHYLNLKSNVLISAFFGLPVRSASADVDIKPKDILLNLFGFQDPREVSGWKTFLNVIKLPFALGWNILNIGVKTIVNIGKLLTEFLPNLGTSYFTEKAKEHGSIGFKVLANVCRFVGFIGRAITSPITGVRHAYHLVNKDPEKSSPARKVAGVLLGVASAMITIATYTILFPLAIKAIGGLVVAKAPTAAKAIVNALEPGAKLFTKVPLIGGLSPTAGLGLAFGTYITTVGLGISRALHNIRSKWYSWVASKKVVSDNKPNVNKAIVPDKKNVQVNENNFKVGNTKTINKAISSGPKNIVDEQKKDIDEKSQTYNCVDFNTNVSVTKFGMTKNNNNIPPYTIPRSPTLQKQSHSK